MKSHRSWVFAAYLVAMTGACGATAPSAWGQDAAAPSKKESPQVVAYKLRHLDAVSAAQMLQQLLESDSENAAGIVPDLVNNYVVVRGSRSQHEVIAEILKQVDSEAPRKHAPEIKIFTLQHALASELSEAMKAVVDKHDVRLAIDQRTNAVIAVGQTEALSILEALLERLDGSVPKSKRSLQPFRVRIVWLLEGREQEKLPAPSGELQGVVDELTKLGFDDLGRVSQLLVHVDAEDSEFEAAGNAEVEGGAVRFSVKGSSLDGRESDRKEPAVGQVRFRLCIHVSPQKGGELMCSLDTELTSPLGHCTVLGTTPLGQRSAVFVVQVLPPAK